MTTPDQMSDKEIQETLQTLLIERGWTVSETFKLMVGMDRGFLLYTLDFFQRHS